jgi:hypothetical protein
MGVFFFVDSHAPETTIQPMGHGNQADKDTHMLFPVSIPPLLVCFA